MSDLEAIAPLVEAINGMDRAPNASDFATMLGFVQPTDETRLFGNLDEVTKLIAVCHLLRKFRTSLSEQEQDVVYNKLAADHMIDLVDKFLAAPMPSSSGFSADVVADFRLNNVYLEIIGAVSHTAYFSKYLRFRKPEAEAGKRLLQSIAERLVQLATSWDQKMLHPPADREPGYYQSAAGTAIQLISTLSAVFVREDINSPILVNEETKFSLIPWLKKWERRHRAEFLGRVSERARSQLERKEQLIRDANTIRRMIKNWDVCGTSGCSSKSNLKACARCQTVRYCCPDHQRAHWSDADEPHKKQCFKTIY